MTPWGGLQGFYFLYIIMALDDLILFQKAYDLFVWIFPIVGKFPKNQRFVLGQQLEMAILHLLELVMQAQKEHMNGMYIKQVCDQIDVVRILIRLSNDVKLLSVRQYAQGAERMNELERIAAGLRKKNTHSFSYGSNALEAQT